MHLGEVFRHPPFNDVCKHRPRYSEPAVYSIQPPCTTHTYNRKGLVLLTVSLYRWYFLHFLVR